MKWGKKERKAVWFRALVLSFSTVKWGPLCPASKPANIETKLERRKPKTQIVCTQRRKPKTQMVLHSNPSVASHSQQRERDQESPKNHSIIAHRERFNDSYTTHVNGI